MKQKQLSKSDIKEINSQLDKQGFQADRKSDAKLIETAEFRIILIDKKPMFFYYENKIVPTLKLLQENNFLKKVTIDMPAVKFIANGADLMRPGIKEIEEFENDDIIAIIDEKNKKPIAVGIALLGSTDMEKMDKGKAVKNIHYIGDRIWNFSF